MTIMCTETDSKKNNRSEGYHQVQKIISKQPGNDNGIPKWGWDSDFYNNHYQKAW